MLSELMEYGRLVELANKQTRQLLQLPVASLTRLQSGICAGSDAEQLPDLTAELGFVTGAEGLPQIGMRISGRMYLECQRCLGPMEWEVGIDSHLTLLESDDESVRLEDPFDSIVVDADGLDLVRVIEDEILTALPLAPVHRNDPHCQEADANEYIAENLTEPMHKPFAGLASIVGGNKNGADD